MITEKDVHELICEIQNIECYDLSIYGNKYRRFLKRVTNYTNMYKKTDKMRLMNNFMMYSEYKQLKERLKKRMFEKNFMDYLK